MVGLLRRRRRRAGRAGAGAAPARRQPWIALEGFGIAHYVLLLGIVIVSVGIKKAIGHAYDPLTTAQALALGGGVTLFLAADVWFRRILGLGRAAHRAVAAVLALATIPLGTEVAAVAQLAALVVILAVALAGEGAARSWPGRSAHRECRRVRVTGVWSPASKPGFVSRPSLGTPRVRAHRAAIAIAAMVCGAPAGAAADTLVTVAGTGTAGSLGDNSMAAAAQLNGARGLARLGDGSILVADTVNNRIRRTAPDGTISTVAGIGTAGGVGDNGPATSAQLNGPRDVAVAPDGVAYFIADTANNRIRRVDAAGTITTAAGSGPRASSATTARPRSRTSTAQAASRSPRPAVCSSPTRPTAASGSW